MAIWNCRVVEHNDEPMSFPFRQVKALCSVDAARVYCETDAWEDLSWDDGDEAVIEVGEDGFVGEPRRVRVNAYTTIGFSAAGEHE